MNHSSALNKFLEPDFSFLQSSALCTYPHSVESGSRWDTYGSSSGWGSNLWFSALGEYVERKHFYLEVLPDFCARLGEVLRAAEVVDLVNAFVQTSTHATRFRIMDAMFSMTAVCRMEDYSACHIPTALLSLTPTVQTMGDEFYPVRDTCGCSAHTTVQAAIYGAIKESMERQFLLRFWLTRKFNVNVGESEALALTQGCSEGHLYRQLSQCGDLQILDISDPDFPGTCFFLCYGSSVGVNGVYYCAGMSYAESRSEALRKSLVELWQTYRFMYSFNANRRSLSELKDPYLVHFFNCNKYETFEAIQGFASRDYVPDSGRLNVGGLIDSMRSNALGGYIYLRQIGFGVEKKFVCKFTAPRIFLHMNNAMGSNLKNDYSSRFWNEVDKNQLNNMVPFP
ncbi:YcaO-like family protein [Pseudomonas phoenicis]|uniref:YcaO-like family protein n=1 Tax=unclassified Pseudomonas TaxID=196821 RepID=UPI0039A3E7BA